MNIKHLFGLGLAASSIFYFAPSVQAQSTPQSDKTGVGVVPSIVGGQSLAVSTVVSSNVSLTTLSRQRIVFVTTQTTILLIQGGLSGFITTPSNFSGISQTTINAINTISGTAPGKASISPTTLVQFARGGTGAGNFFVIIISNIFASRRSSINNGTLVANAGNSLLLAQEDAEFEAKIKALPPNVVSNAAILAVALEGMAPDNKVSAGKLLISVRAYNELLRSLDEAQLPLDPPELKSIGGILASLVNEVKTASTQP